MILRTLLILCIAAFTIAGLRANELPYFKINNVSDGGEIPNPLKVISPEITKRFIELVVTYNKNNIDGRQVTLSNIQIVHYQKVADLNRAGSISYFVLYRFSLDSTIPRDSKLFSGGLELAYVTDGKITQLLPENLPSPLRAQFPKIPLDSLDESGHGNLDGVAVALSADKLGLALSIGGTCVVCEVSLAGLKPVYSSLREPMIPTDGDSKDFPNGGRFIFCSCTDPKYCSLLEVRDHFKSRPSLKAFIFDPIQNVFIETPSRLAALKNSVKNSDDRLHELHFYTIYGDLAPL